MHLLRLFRFPFALAIVGALAAVVAGYWPLVVLALVAAAGVWMLGRNPARKAPSLPLGIVSPVDGRISGISRQNDPFLEREALCVHIRQSVLAPALLCGPTEGRVCHIWAGPDMPGADAGDRLAIHLRTDDDDDVVLVITRAHGLHGPLAWSIQPGERVGQGQHRGLAGWGRRVTLYVPKESQPAVESKERVYAASSLVCELVQAD